MKIFNLVYKIKKANTVKAVWWIVSECHTHLYFNKIKFFNHLLSCKSVNPLHFYYSINTFTYQHQTMSCRITNPLGVRSRSHLEVNLSINPV